MCLWIVPISGLVLFAFNEIANPRRAFLGKVLWKGDPRGVGLTFDDGPHPLYTPRVLEILDSFQAQATFFVIGRHLKEHGDLVVAASKAGHVIGNHTEHHSWAMNFSSAKKMRQEVLACQSEVEKWAGYKPRFYRQPAGFRNPKIFGILKELQISMVGWQVRAFDTQCQNPKGIARRILQKVQPGGVILLHDGSNTANNQDRTATLQALPEILGGLKDRGMEFLTLDKLFGMSKELR
ncbi:MAG: polysaccharide deacetylase family protein [Thermodesulfobacteriota bacterium]|jgi:peptidoglycan/xylan/chitin deacetylase (PgdA/CDA1 family)